MKQKYRVIGIMSGTSLDGLDIAYCEFKKGRRWQYKIKLAKTVKYGKKWKDKLGGAFNVGKKTQNALDIDFGKYIGKKVAGFIKVHKLKVDFIASHGHTIFHQPAKGITLQIGSGNKIASICGVSVVCDFRSGDVALGGQGAPLVPLVDKLLFPQYVYCLNLGGFANTSFDDRNSERIAYDICPVNIVLNELSSRLGLEYDNQGRVAAKGKVHLKMLKKLNSLIYYKRKPPKSLGREWVENTIWPILNSYNISMPDKLRTMVEHVAMQIGVACIKGVSKRKHSILVSGGGTYNLFLLKRIAVHTNCKLIVPNDKTIQFKEAMAFAFLGVLKMEGKINILKSVTGAKRDSSGGKICFPT